MTCRIEGVGIGECLVILRISGKITGQDVELRALPEQETRALVLDLKDLLLADREAVKLLALREFAKFAKRPRGRSCRPNP